MTVQTNEKSARNSGIHRVVRLIAQALSGEERDYTTGSLSKAVMLLAIPMVLEMGMESVFAVVDIFFVSSLGADAVAVVGLTEAVITLIYAVAVGFGMAVTAVVARRIGEGNTALASVTAGQVLLLGLLMSAAIAAIGLAFSKDILLLMGASAEVLEQGKGYIQLMLGGSATIIYLFIIAAVFRGAGDAIIAMRGLWIANGINIVLDPCFIFGWGPFPELGVTGAAVATNIGRGIGALYMLYHLVKGELRIRVRLPDLRFSPSVSLALLRVSVGGILQFFIATASWVLLMRVVALFGSEAIAGFTIAVRIAMFTFLPAWGLSNAAATLVGQCLGAGNPGRAEKAVWKTAQYNVSFMLTVSVVMLVFPQALVSIFTDAPQVLAIGGQILQILALGYGFFALGMVMTQAFNGAGDTRTPTWINLVCFWLIQIPLAYSLALFVDLGAFGVALAVPAAESLIALLAFWQFRSGRWRRVRV